MEFIGRDKALKIIGILDAYSNAGKKLGRKITIQQADGTVIAPPVIHPGINKAFKLLNANGYNTYIGGVSANALERINRYNAIIRNFNAAANPTSLAVLSKDELGELGYQIVKQKKFGTEIVLIVANNGLVTRLLERAIELGSNKKDFAPATM